MVCYKTHLFDNTPKGVLNKDKPRCVTVTHLSCVPGTHHGVLIYTPRCVNEHSFPKVCKLCSPKGVFPQHTMVC